MAASWLPARLAVTPSSNAFFSAADFAAASGEAPGILPLISSTAGVLLPVSSTWAKFNAVLASGPAREEDQFAD